MDMAQSMINISSIYSEIGNHSRSLLYAEKAVEIIEPAYEERYPADMGSPEFKIKFSTVVANTYHTAAIEYDFADDFSNCLIMYQKALRVSKINLGNGHPLTQTLETNFENAKERINLNPTIANRSRAQN